MTSSRKCFFLLMLRPTLLIFSNSLSVFLCIWSRFIQDQSSSCFIIFHLISLLALFVESPRIQSIVIKSCLTSVLGSSMGFVISDVFSLHVSLVCYFWGSSARLSGHFFQSALLLTLTFDTGFCLALYFAIYLPGAVVGLLFLTWNFVLCFVDVSFINICPLILNCLLVEQ